MTQEKYESLRLQTRDGVATVTFDHPPINLMDATLLTDLTAVVQAISESPDIRVLVLQSANEDFFIAHADVHMIQEIPPAEEGGVDIIAAFHETVDQMRTLPMATIAKIEGRCRGGGSELALACDMRFAAIGRARLAQPELGIGITPGGGALTRLPRLIGRARALEVILGCADFDAELAERYGYVNRAIAAGEIGGFVDALAKRIASFPPEAIALAKQGTAAADSGLKDSLSLEANLFVRSVHTTEARERMPAILAAGLQTPETELDGYDSLFAAWEAD
jgi:enoyl-CoA hydratase/carnithine racemase